MIIHDQPPHLSCEILLKRSLEVGLFIGKGGETIKDLRERRPGGWELMRNLWVSKMFTKKDRARWILTSFNHVFFIFCEAKSSKHNAI